MHSSSLLCLLPCWMGFIVCSSSAAAMVRWVEKVRFRGPWLKLLGLLTLSLFDPPVLNLAGERKSRTSSFLFELFHKLRTQACTLSGLRCLLFVGFIRIFVPELSTSILQMRDHVVFATCQRYRHACASCSQLVISIDSHLYGRRHSQSSCRSYRCVHGYRQRVFVINLPLHTEPPKRCSEASFCAGQARGVRL